GRRGAAGSPRAPRARPARVRGPAVAWLDRFLHLAGLEAAGADVGARRHALQQHADALEVRVEAPLRRHHRVRAVMSERRLLAAADADLRHRPDRLAGPGA